METITFDGTTIAVLFVLAAAFIFFAIGFGVVNHQNKELKSGNANLHKMYGESEMRCKERLLEFQRQKKRWNICFGVMTKSSWSRK